MAYCECSGSCALCTAIACHMGRGTQGGWLLSTPSPYSNPIICQTVEQSVYCVFLGLSNHFTVCFGVSVYCVVRGLSSQFTVCFGAHHAHSMVDLQAEKSFTVCPTILETTFCLFRVKPVYKGHSKNQLNVTSLDRWPF